MTNQDQVKTVKLPQLAESVVDATIAKWLKQPGDSIQYYEPICELITDKVTAELPSTEEGILQEILVPEGETVKVGTVLCTIGTEATDQNGQRGESSFTQQPDQESSGAHEGGSVSANSSSAEEGTMRKRYSPAVLRLAEEHQLDLQLIDGTGLGGRITRKDVQAYLESGPRQKVQSAPTSQPKDASPQSASALNPQPDKDASPPVRSSGLHLTPPPAFQMQERTDAEREGRGEYLLDVSPVRNAIATRMRQSVTEIPHAWTMIEVDVTNLVTLRNELKTEFMKNEGVNLTYLAFVIKAVVNAIKDYPIMNSVWAIDKIIVKRDINISLAVGTEDAVYAPVIKNADQKNIAGLAREIDTLTKKARAVKLSPADVQGGSFTVNNTGSFGSILSQPIINYPQAANFTFEAIVKRPVVIHDMIAVRHMANICLSLDHRILDGVICGRFLQRVKENIEGYTSDTKLY
ncbi:dihydrolipoamide acetyltransferase family protein [Marinicrinis sediminis]|uniref:Dihydrolipoamide acetyltransferase component of pyruvate dehydrogenase complex n=1 Tax=Marinicrinis sediminis TaxID=1652465 RepID=A0ABW5RDP8_9BACL